jgi:hypothetical protein
MKNGLAFGQWHLTARIPLPAIVSEDVVLEVSVEKIGDSKKFSHFLSLLSINHSTQ